MFDVLVRSFTDAFEFFSPLGVGTIAVLIGLAIWKQGVMAWVWEALIGIGLGVGLLAGVMLAANSTAARAPCIECGDGSVFFGERKGDRPMPKGCCYPGTGSAPGMLIPGALDR